MGKGLALQRASQLEQEVRAQIVSLKGDLARLQGEKDILDREAEDSAKSLSDIQHRKDELEKEIEAASSMVLSLKTSAQEAFSESVAELQRAREILRKFKDILQSLEQKTTKAKDDLRDVLKQKEAVFAEISAERAVLRLRRAELDAFEAFIRDVYSNEIFPLSAFNL